MPAVVAVCVACAVSSAWIRPPAAGACARQDDGSLVGFVNVAWDGGDRALLLDPKVRPVHQHAGVRTELVRRAALHAEEAGCEWPHVDFDDDLAPFLRWPADSAKTLVG